MAYEYQPGQPTIAELEHHVTMLRRMKFSGVRKTVTPEGGEVEYRTMADLNRALSEAEQALGKAAGIIPQGKRTARKRIIVR